MDGIAFLVDVGPRLDQAIVMRRCLLRLLRGLGWRELVGGGGLYLATRYALESFETSDAA